MKWAGAAYPGAYYLCPSVLEWPVCLCSLCNTLGHKSQSIRTEGTDEQTSMSTVHADQHIVNLAVLLASTKCHAIPDNKVHGANMGPTWVLSAPCGPHKPCYQGYCEVQWITRIMHMVCICFALFFVWYMSISPKCFWICFNGTEAIILWTTVNAIITMQHATELHTCNGMYLKTFLDEKQTDKLYFTWKDELRDVYC